MVITRSGAGACALVLSLAALAAPAAASAGPGQRVQRAARRQRVLRTWRDTIKTPGGEVARRVEVVFDYDRGVAYENAYDSAGALLSSVTLVRELPRPSQEEIDEAVGILRADPSIGRILQRTGAEPLGVFVLEEPEGRACGPRTRCLQVMVVSPDHRGLLRRVVVDLVRGGIVYRAYVPTETEVAK